MSAYTVREKVTRFMREHQMTEAGDGILAAVSGGADSVCLLCLLHEIAGEGDGIRLAAFHLNHGLRGDEADRDEVYVRELCGTLKIPFFSAHEQVAEYAEERGLSEEEAGRVLRYAHLERLCGELGFQRIAVAHHRNDNAETVLMNLFRGSGFRGLGGIRPVRGKIIRPLLELSREEIEGYLRERRIGWCEDSTNRESTYGRNRVRNELLPWVTENVNGRAADHLLQTAALAAQADEYFTGEAKRILSMKLPPGAPGIDTDVFDGLPDIIKSYVVQELIDRAAGGRKDISARHIEAVCRLSGPGGGRTVNLPYGLLAVRGYRTLEIQRAERASGDAGLLPQLPGIKTRIFPWKKDLEIPKNGYTKWFDYDKIRGSLTVRTRKNGDYFLIEGGKKKLLKRYFIDEKIPEALRGEVPLLAEADHILWVIGYRISDYYKITDTTRTVFEVNICKGENHG